MKAKPMVTLVTGAGRSIVGWSAEVASVGGRWAGASARICWSGAVGGLTLVGVVGGGRAPWSGVASRVMAVLSARGVEGRAPGAVSGMAWKLTIVAPDSGQNLETRTRPGGALKAWSLTASAVVGGSQVCV